MVNWKSMTIHEERLCCVIKFPHTYIYGLDRVSSLFGYPVVFWYAWEQNYAQGLPIQNLTPLQYSTQHSAPTLHSIECSLPTDNICVFCIFNCKTINPFKQTRIYLKMNTGLTTVSNTCHDS